MFGNKPIVVAEIYRPPNGSVDTFNDSLDDCLSKINKEGKFCYLMGDFNINLININQHTPTDDLVNSLFSCGYVPLINKPTRVTEHCATLIDHLYSNALKLFGEKSISGVLLNALSDHFPIFHVCDVTRKGTTKTTTTITQQVININTLYDLRVRLREQNWSIVTDQHDTNKAYDSFEDIFNNCCKESIPIFKRKVPTTQKPWITQSILNSIKRKNKLYKAYLKHPCSITAERYKNYKNRLTHLLRVAERSYVKEYLEDNRTNMKKTWSLINNLLGKRTKLNLPGKITQNGSDITDKKEIADEFNTYLTNVGPSLAAKIKSNHDYMNTLNDDVTSSIYLAPVTYEEINRIIINLKHCSPGADGITVSLLKAVKDEIIPILVQIINSSFQEGIFPDRLKVATVVPVYKSGDKNTLSKYRPISILPLFSEIFERVVHSRIIDYLDKYNILYDEQYGFRKNHSTDLALVNVTDFILSSLESKESVIGVYMDLSKAFDKINHNILLKKLHNYGIRGTALKWIKHYLSNRSQLVKYDNAVSDAHFITCGVPQG